MSFKNGFEKMAVSSDWIGKRLGGGVATRAGISRGSPAYQRIGAAATESLKASGKSHGEILERVREINKATKGNSEKSWSLLDRLHGEVKWK